MLSMLQTLLPNILLYLADVFYSDKLYIQTHIHKSPADGYLSLWVYLQAQGTGIHLSCIGSMVHHFTVFPMCLMEDDKSSTQGESIEVPKIVQQVKGLTKKGDLKLM